MHGAWEAHRIQKVGFGTSRLLKRFYMVYKITHFQASVELKTNKKNKAILSWCFGGLGHRIQAKEFRKTVFFFSIKN
jgi:hypothetical protein